MNQSDSISGDKGVVRTPGDWDTETIIARIHRDLDGSVTPSMIREVLDEVIPKYKNARIQTFVPVLVQRDAVKRLKSGRYPLLSQVVAAAEATDLAEGAIGAAELGAAIAEDAIAEQMDEPESETD